MMKRRGPDSLEGWFIAFICCLISTLMYGASGLSGMLFVASVLRYDTDRDKASFPYILSTVLQAVSGPFAGYFANRFGSRIVIFVGSILGFVGIGTCFFAEDIMTVTILWGIVFGIGFGLSSLLLPVIINEYFFKQRSIALGMSYLGSPIGFFIFPPIFETLLNKYGLSGTFLIIAGINMHCLPLSMLLKPANFKTERENSPLKCGEKYDSYSSTNPIVTNLSQESEIENKQKAKINGNADSFIRRHSIEFLWKQPSSKEEVTDKKYVMSLNKKCSCEKDDTKIQRSFRKISKNIHGNLEEKGNEKNKHALDCDAYKYDKTISVATTIDENDKYSKYFKTVGNIYYQKCEPCLKNVLVPNEPHFGKEKNQFPHNFKCHRYDVVSTIYFGTDQSSYVYTDCKSREKRHFDENNKYKKTENVLSFPSHMKYDGVFESAYSLKIPVLLTYKKADDFFRHENGDVYGKETVAAHEPFTKNVAHSQNLLFSMYLNPVFILICIINAIVNIHFTALITVIVDFSRDHNIDIEYEKYIMMGISLSGAFGMMGLGWVTDCGYMSRTHFGTFTQVISGICTTILPFTVGFESLMMALLIWCVCQSSFIPLIPAITADYFDEDIQAVAISACNVLSGPLYLIIPPLIGYFRDERGSYDNIFFLLGTLAFIDCIIVLIIPYIVRWRSRKNMKH